jgi:hypothetical protein
LIFSKSPVKLVSVTLDRERLTTHSELTDLGNRFGQQFFPRRDLQARQLEDGRYICIHKPLRVEHLEKHLRGEITLGSYVLDKNSQARFIVLDADDDTGFERLVHTAQMLAVDKTPSYLEASRRGGHLWLFFGEPLPGKLARNFGNGLMAVHQVNGVEQFPKQDKLGEGPGSLIRAPFGVHRQTQQRYDFLNLEGNPLAVGLEEQMWLLTHPRVIPLEVVKTYAAQGTEAKKIYDPDNEPFKKRQEPKLSEQIKARVSVMEFISRYIELKPTDTGAVGCCPFHTDQHPSLGINREQNYWYCFAGCGGGSVIDFWIKWRICDFKTAVSELAKIVL